MIDIFLHKSPMLAYFYGRDLPFLDQFVDSGDRDFQIVGDFFDAEDLFDGHLSFSPMSEINSSYFPFFYFIST